MNLLRFGKKLRSAPESGNGASTSTSSSSSSSSSGSTRLGASTDSISSSLEGTHDAIASPRNKSKKKDDDEEDEADDKLEKDGNDDESFDSEFHQKTAEQRKHDAIVQLISIQDEYLKSIDRLMENYIQPFQHGKRKAPKLSSKQLNEIFLNIPVLRDSHRNVRQSLEAYLNGSCERNVGVILTSEWTVFTSYCQYAKKAPAAGYALRELASKSAVKSFLLKMAAEEGQDIFATKRKERRSALDSKDNATGVKPSKSSSSSSSAKKPTVEDITRPLRRLLELPIRHMQLYQEPLKTLLCATPASSSDHIDILVATAKLSELAKYLYDLDKQQEKKREYDIIEGRVLSGGPLHLYDRNRHYVRKGDIMHTVKGKKQRRYAFLFTDRLLICERMTNYIFKLCNDVSLREATVMPLDDSPSQPQTKIEQFKIVCPNETYLLREPKAESSIPDPQSGKWYIRLDQTITKLKLGSAFGAPLEVLLEKEQSSIPCVVLDSVAYIQKYASLQGLFFIEGRRSAVRRLRRRWDNFHRTGKAVELSNSNPFDVSSALLNFLELLPVPLLEFQGKKDTSIDFSRVKDEAYLMQHMKEKVAAIPADSHHRHLLEFIVFFLSRMATMIGRLRSNSGGDSASVNLEHSLSATAQDIAKWMSSVLAINFGMAIYRPVKPTLHYVQNAEFFVRCTKLLIEQPNAILSVDLSDAAAIRGISITELLDGDPFGPHWRSIMAEESHTLEYLSQPDNVAQLVRALVAQEPCTSDTARIDATNRRALAAKLALTRDGLVHRIALKHDACAAFFSNMFEAHATDASSTTPLPPTATISPTAAGAYGRSEERSFRYVGEVLEQLFISSTERIERFFTDEPTVNRQLIELVSSDNIATSLCAVVRSVSECNTPSATRLLSSWVELVLLQLTRLESLSAEAIAGCTNLVGTLLFYAPRWTRAPCCASNPELLAPLLRALFDDTARMGAIVAAALELADASKRNEALGFVAVLIRGLEHYAELSSERAAVVTACLDNAPAICRALELEPGRPVGMTRLQLVRLVALLLFDHRYVDSAELVRSHLLPTVVALFLAAPTHSILGSVVTRACCSLLAASHSATTAAGAVRFLACESGLVRAILEAAAAASPPPNRGHLFEIANALQRSALASELIAADTANAAQWTTFCTKDLAAFNALNAGERIDVGKSKAPWWFYCQPKHEDAY